MLFHLRLFLHAIRKNTKFFVFVLVPPLAYLAFQAYVPYTYTLAQDFVTEEQTVFAFGPNPLDIVQLQEIKENPDLLFTDRLALMDLRNHLLVEEAVQRPEWTSWLPSQVNLFIQRSLHHNVSLQDKDGNRMSLVYDGPDRELGQAMLSFYTQRLLHGAQKAQERSLVDVAVSRTQALGQGAFPGIAVDGPVQIAASRLLYHPDRLGPALWVLCISVLVFLALVWLMEHARPKLYTPRQTSRYLNVRVLGQLPDLNKLKFH